MSDIAEEVRVNTEATLSYELFHEEKTSVGLPAKTYINHFCADSAWCLEK